MKRSRLPINCCLLFHPFGSLPRRTTFRQNSCVVTENWIILRNPCHDARVHAKTPASWHSVPKKLHICHTNSYFQQLSGVLLGQDKKSITCKIVRCSEVRISSTIPDPSHHCLVRRCLAFLQVHLQVRCSDLSQS